MAGIGVKRTLKRVESGSSEWLLSARSGRSSRVETPPERAELLLSNQVVADASLTSGGLD